MTKADKTTLATARTALRIFDLFLMKQISVKGMKRLHSQLCHTPGVDREIPAPGAGVRKPAVMNCAAGSEPKAL